MAELVIVCWRDIPAQIIVKIGRKAAKRQLADRFQEAIDRAAMRAGLRDTDGYLGEWRRVAAGNCGDDLEAEADGAAARSMPIIRQSGCALWWRMAAVNPQPRMRPNDRHGRQLRHQRGRDRFRAAVLHHRRAHQPDRAQAPRGRDGGRRLRHRRGRHARPGRGRRPHARRQRRHPARRRAADPRRDDPARAVADRRAAVDRFLDRRGARGRARGLPGQAAWSTR